MLEQFGHEADAVPGGGQAVEALRRSDYDLVLMDCWMPEMDGYEATRRIRDPANGVRNPGIPILALTADAMPHVRDDCLRAGMNDYLTKPIDFRELKLRLGKWLHRESTRPVFDRDDLLERLMGNFGLARRIITRFVADAPAQLAALAGAIESCDPAVMWQAAHSVKGAAANAGAVRLSEVARSVELLARSGDIAAARERAIALPRLFEDYCAEAVKFDRN